MELTSPLTNTLKINTRKGNVLIDPENSDDARIIILSDNSKTEISQTPENLVIYGPGDFEAGGILIKGTRGDADTVYSIDTGEGRVLIASSSSVSKLSDEDDYSAVIVKATDTVDEATLDALSAGLVVVYGDPTFIPAHLAEKKVNKVNLKKIDELDSNVVYLEKK